MLLVFRATPYFINPGILPTPPFLWEKSEPPFTIAIVALSSLQNFLWIYVYLPFQCHFLVEYISLICKATQRLVFL